MRLLHILVFLLTLMLSGCSSFGFLFERLDWLTVWQLDRMFDLSEEQEAQVRPATVEIQRWLRQEGFPKIINELNQTLSLWESDQLEQAIERFEVSSRVLAQEFIVVSLPLIIPLATSLTENNAEHYRQYCLDKQPRWFGYAESDESKVDSRIERFEDWFGDLSDAQTTMVAQSSALFPKERQIRIDNNNRWREQIIEAALTKKSEQLTLWLQQPELLWTEPYTELYERNYSAIKSLLQLLMPTLSDKQKQHASERVRTWIVNMEEVI